jgi:hypothetical protein
MKPRIVHEPTPMPHMIALAQPVPLLPPHCLLPVVGVMSDADPELRATWLLAGVNAARAERDAHA